MIESPKLIIESIGHVHQTKDEVKENREKNDGYIVLKTLLQRADRKNQMGRIYPKELLVREFRAYQRYVDDASALGECFSFTASVLTKSGWKPIKDVAEDEVVLTYNVETKMYEEQQIEAKIAKPFKGKMIHIKGRNIDTLVTPDHKFHIVNRNGKGQTVTATEMLNYKDSSISHSYIPKTGQWTGNNMDVFTLPGIGNTDKFKNNVKPKMEKYVNSIDIDAKTWFAFLGLWLAEGHVTTHKVTNGYSVQISQKKEGNIQPIRELLASFPKEFYWGESKHEPTGKITFACSDHRLWMWLKPLGLCYDKYIPEEIKQASPQLLDELFQWFLLGDGRDFKNYNYTNVVNYCPNRKNVFSVSERLVYDLQEVLVKTGGAGNITKVVPDKDCMIRGRVIKAENKQPIYTLNVSTTNGLYLDKRMITITEVDYDDMVYCIKVPNGAFYCKDFGSAAIEFINNKEAFVDYSLGKCFITKNCDHPDLSVVTLDRTSHLITRQWEHVNEKGQWEWWGDVRLLNTDLGIQCQRLIEDGVKLGISSRGAGTVQKSQTEDADVVQSNFIIIAFDIVSKPSVHSANLFLKEALDLNMNKEAYSRYLQNQIQAFVELDLKNRYAR